MFNENSFFGVLLVVFAFTWPYWLAFLFLVSSAGLGWYLWSRREGQGRVLPVGGLVPFVLSLVGYPFVKMLLWLVGQTICRLLAHRLVDSMMSHDKRCIRCRTTIKSV